MADIVEYGYTKPSKSSIYSVPGRDTAVSFETTVEPTTPLVTDAEVAAELGLLPGDDASLAIYVAAATDAIDGPASETGQCFRTRTIQAEFRWWPPATDTRRAVVRLPGGRVQAVTGIVYQTMDGEGTVNLADVELHVENQRSYVRFGEVPMDYRPDGYVRVTYTCGTSTIPPEIKLLALSIVRDFDTFRGASDTRMIRKNYAKYALWKRYDIRDAQSGEWEGPVWLS